MFYTRLKEMTNRAGTSPTALARELGLSTGNVGRWAKGSTPSVDILSKIASRLNTTTDYLLGKTNNPGPTDDKEIRDEDIKFALFDGAKEITPAMFEEVKAFAKFVQAREAQKAKENKKEE